MKKLTEQQVDDLLKLRFGQVVEEPGHTAYVSNAVLAKIFRIPRSTVANLQRARFERVRLRNLPLMQRLQPLEKCAIP